MIIRFLNLCLITLVGAGCGAKHHVIGDSESARLGKLVRPNFASINQHVIQPKCVSCHREATTKNHHIVLTDYKAIVESKVFPPLIVPGRPEQSSLIKAMASGAMPKDSSRIPEVAIENVAEWIANGALESEDDQVEPPDCTEGDPDCPKLPPECEPGEPGCGEDNDWN